MLNELVIEDAFKATGGDPFVGCRLGTLLREAGVERVQVRPGYAPALSNVETILSVVRRRLNDD